MSDEMIENKSKSQDYLYDYLFFSAHPDDAEFQAGGLLLKLSKKYKVINIILTKGEAGTYGTPAERVKEAQAAGEYAGYDVEFMDFCDNFVEYTAANAHKLSAVIRKHKPKIVFATYHTHNTYHHDPISHPDHAATGQLARSACRFAKFKNAKVSGELHCVNRIVYYMIPLRSMPSFVVDISDVAAELPKFWACHKTQFENILKGKVNDRLLTIRKSTGMLINVDYAEGFIVEEPVKLDVDGILKI